jgi:hypothetical protein
MYQLNTHRPVSYQCFKTHIDPLYVLYMLHRSSDIEHMSREIYPLQGSSQQDRFALSFFLRLKVAHLEHHNNSRYYSSQNMMRIYLHIDHHESLH